MEKSDHLRPFPWQPGPATQRQMVACFNFGPGMDIYAAGYRRAAEVLAEHIADTGESQDLLVFPLMFCLRHALELNFKELIANAGILLETDHVAYQKTHNLDALWKVCSVLLREVWPNEDEPFDQTTQVVAALCALDSTSEGFRYFHTAEKKDRQNGLKFQPTLDKDLRHLDLAAAYTEVSSVLDLLEGAQAGIDQHIEWKADAQSIRREFEDAVRREFEDAIRREFEEPYRGEQEQSRSGEDYRLDEPRI